MADWLDGYFENKPIVNATVSPTIPANTVTTAMIQANAVGKARMAKAAANTLTGNATNALADMTDIPVAQSRLVGRGSTGDIAGLTLGTGLTFGAGTVLTPSLYWVSATSKLFDSDGIEIPFTGVTLTDVWNAGGVRWDGTDLIDENAAIISNVLQSATIAALPAASTKAGKIYIVDNPGNNTKGLPATVYSLSSKWQFTGGDALIAEDCPDAMYTVPAATWDDTPSFTFTSVASGAQTKVTSGGGVHGLTTAAQITAGDSYIYVSGGTNWTVGWYKITVVDSTTAVTINHPYSASFGQPTFGMPGDTLIALRLKLPPLSSTGKALLRRVVDHTHAGIDSTAITVEHVASGGAAGSGYSILAPTAETTNAPIVSGICGFFNKGATNVQRTLYATGDADGWGSLNTGVIAAGAVQTNVATDIISTVNIAAAGDSVKICNYGLRVTL